AGADTLGERALRVELDLKLPGQVLLGEQFVLAHIGRDHLLDLPRIEQQAEACPVDTGIVRDDGEVLHAGVADRHDQRLRNAAEAEAACTDEHAVLQQSGERALRVRIDFLHTTRPLSSNPWMRPPSRQDRTYTTSFRPC